MTDTDRTKIKKFQAGELATAGLSNIASAIPNLHQHARDFVKTGTENAETNVAESPMYTIKTSSKRKLVDWSIVPTANIASNDTDYLVVNVYKRVNGVSTRIGWYNTHTNANGAMTELLKHSCNTVQNSDREINGGLPFMTYDVKKYGAGKVLGALSVFSFAWEDL